MSTNGTDTGDQDPKILGFDVFTFVIIVAGGIIGLVVLSIFPYIWCKRRSLRNKQWKDQYAEESGGGRKARGGFLNRFSVRRSRNPWITRLDNSGRTYWENTNTGEISYTDPNVSSHVDPQTGQPYYMNQQTGVSFMVFLFKFQLYYLH